MTTLRTALQRSGWTCFQNDQHEVWNTTDLLNDFPPGTSDWLDRPITVLISEEGQVQEILDCDGESLTEYREQEETS